MTPDLSYYWEGAGGEGEGIKWDRVYKKKKTMFDCTSFLFFFVNAYPNMLIVPSFFATGDGGGPIERGNMPSYEEEQEKAFFNVRGVPARTRVHLYRGAVLVTAWGEGIRIKVVF